MCASSNSSECFNQKTDGVVLKLRYCSFHKTFQNNPHILKVLLQKKVLLKCLIIPLLKLKELHFFIQNLIKLILMMLFNKAKYNLENLELLLIYNI